MSLAVRYTLTSCLLAVGLGSFAAANPADCYSFIGGYKGVYNETFSSDLESLVIESADKGNTLTMTFQLRGGHPNKTGFVMDGKEHTGDGYWSGAPYVGHCSRGKIKIVNDFRQLKHPLIYDFTISGNELNLIETIGEHSVHTGKLIRNGSKE